MISETITIYFLVLLFGSLGGLTTLLDSKTKLKLRSIMASMLHSGLWAFGIISQSFENPLENQGQVVGLAALIGLCADIVSRWVIERWKSGAILNFIKRDNDGDH